MTNNVFTGRQLEAVAELAQRNSAALTMFRPQSHQDIIFKHNRFREALIRGGNRSGKSVCSAVLFASAAMGLPVTLSDGVTKIETRRPHQKGKCLTMWMVGYDQKHIGQTLYRLLFKAGLFKIIRDKETKQWRSYREWDPEDKAREGETKPSPPLIPSRYVDPKSWDWDNYRGREFKKVVIWDPITHEPIAEIYAYSSKGDVKAGDPVDIIWIDEKIEYPEHYPELQARLMDRNGFMFWSSWPAEDNEALSRLDERADECIKTGSDLVHRVVLRTSDNKSLDAQSVAQTRAGFTEEEILARDSGEFNTTSFRFYPLFDERIHIAVVDNSEDALSKAIRENEYKVPENWTRYLILDPGTSHPGVLMAAVPPPMFGKYFVPYDEIYIGRADAFQLAELIEYKTRGQVFQKFIIDRRAGRQTAMGFTQKVTENYANAFKKYNLKSLATGSNFQYGSDNPPFRANIVREMLHIDSSGFPKLRVLNGKCPNFVKQMTKCMKKRIGKTIDEERKSDSFPHDLVDCYEYFAASAPEYFPVPTNIGMRASAPYQLFKLLSGKLKKPEESEQLGPQYESV